MADECIEGVSIPRKYDVKTLRLLTEKLSAKAKSLGKGWTAASVGDCLWAVSYTTNTPPTPKKVKQQPVKSVSSFFSKPTNKKTVRKNKK